MHALRHNTNNYSAPWYPLMSLTDMTQQHTIDDFIAAFGLVKKGKEYVGPCPVCKDGEDRFHVREGTSGPVFGCRYCMDKGNDPNSENAKKGMGIVARWPLNYQNGTPKRPETRHSAAHRHGKNRRHQSRSRCPLAKRTYTSVCLHHDSDGGIVFVQLIRHGL